MARMDRSEGRNPGVSRFGFDLGGDECINWPIEEKSRGNMIVIIERLCGWMFHVKCYRGIHLTRKANGINDIAGGWKVANTSSRKVPLPRLGSTKSINRFSEPNDASR